MKISLSVKLLMRKIMEDVPKTTVFRTSSTMVCKDRGFDKAIDEQISSIDSDIDNYSQNGSGWIIDKVLEIHVHIVKCSVMEWTIYGWVKQFLSFPTLISIVRVNFVALESYGKERSCSM